MIEDKRQIIAALNKARSTTEDAGTFFYRNDISMNAMKDYFNTLPDLNDALTYFMMGASAVLAIIEDRDNQTN